MLRAALLLVALQSMPNMPVPPLVEATAPSESAFTPQQIPEGESNATAAEDDNLSVALVFDVSVAAPVRQQIRLTAEDLTGIELQPAADTESLLRGMECADQWLSCQILTGRRLGVEKLVQMRFLSSDALHLEVIDVKMETSRGEMVVAWVNTSDPESPSMDDALRARLRTSFLVLLREDPVMGEISLRGSATGRVRIDGVVMPLPGGGGTEHVYSLFAGTHLIEVEDVEGEWNSVWLEIPGERRIELAIPQKVPKTDKTAPEPLLRADTSTALRAGLIAGGTVTVMGSLGFLGVATFVAQQPVSSDTSVTEVSQRLKLWEYGQRSAWIFGGIGIGALGAGLLWEIFQNQDFSVESDPQQNEDLKH